MGRAKHEMEEREGKLQSAERIAIQAGLLKECFLHGYAVSTGNFDYTEAYKLGNAMMSKGEALTECFESRKEMTDLIKEAIEFSGEECPGCEKLSRE